MFTRKLAFIEDLEKLEQGVSKNIELSNAIKVFESIANLFDSLFDSFSTLIITFFVDIPQFPKLPLG